MTQAVANACGRRVKNAVYRNSVRLIGEVDGRRLPLDQWAIDVIEFTPTKCREAGYELAAKINARYRDQRVYTWKLTRPSALLCDTTYAKSNGVMVRGISQGGMWPPSFEFRTLVRFDVLSGVTVKKG